MHPTTEPTATDAGTPVLISSAPWSPRRRRFVGAVSVFALLAVIALAPDPILRVINTNNAHRLVDELAQEQAGLLSRQSQIRGPIRGLGAPARSWTEVSCWLTPRYSDGDGEQDLIMFYWQECALVAYEIYPLAPGAGDAAEVAARLGGHTAGTPTCAETLFDVLSPDIGAGGKDDYATSLWWTTPSGDPPAHQPTRCALPSPEDPDSTLVSMGVDKPLTADAYVVYRVRSPVRATEAGCRHAFTWLAPCTGKPDGFPVV